MPASGGLFGSSPTPNRPTTTKFSGKSSTPSPSRMPAYGLFGSSSMPSDPSHDNIFGASSSPSGLNPFAYPSSGSPDFARSVRNPFAQPEPHGRADDFGASLFPSTPKTDYRSPAFGGFTPIKTIPTESATYGADSIKQEPAGDIRPGAEDNTTESKQILDSLERFFKEEDKADEAIIDAARKRIESRGLQLRTLQSKASSDSGIDTSQIANNDAIRIETSKIVQDHKINPTSDGSGSMSKQGEVTSHDTAKVDSQGFGKYIRDGSPDSLFR